MDKNKSAREWFKQAEYDLETAGAMFKSGRYIYTVFMCHMAIEKALKGLYAEKLSGNPPKIHDLNYLSEKISLNLSMPMQDFLDYLNDVSVPTRYPDEIDKLLKEYNKKTTAGILKQAKILIACLKKKL